MKKLITLIMVFSMVLSMASFAFAAGSSYTKSPVVQDTPNIKSITIISDEENAPEIVIEKSDEGTIQFYTEDGDGPAEDDCLVTLKVTPYAEKEEITTIPCKVTDGTSASGEVSAEERLIYARQNSENGTDGMGETNFKEWREIISDAANSNLDGAAEADAKIQNKDIAIVSVFDVSVWCEKPKQHELNKHHCVHTLRLTFGDDEMTALLNNYVALMHFNRAGEWEYIPSKFYEDPVTKEDVVEFSIDCDNLSPFAIAAFSEDAAIGGGAGFGVPTSPQTGESVPAFYFGAAALTLGLACYFFVKGRKKDAK